MAKRRSINPVGAGTAIAVPTLDASPLTGASPWLFPPALLLGLAGAMIAAGLVYAGYWPADSIEVQAGAARYLAGLMIVAGGLAIVVRPGWNEPNWRLSDRLIDIAAWGVPFWMILSTLSHAADANLRMAVNELWWWIAAAALLSAARRVVLCSSTSIAFLNVISGVAVAVAIFGWHQLLISFPEMISQYEANPDAMLREAGIVAEEGTALRIVFQNRLYDGGPTGPFALANSMAALLTGGVVVMIGLAWQRWQQLSIAARLGWLAAIGVTLGMLLASRSRSAVGAVLIVGVVAAIRYGLRGHSLRSRRDEAAIAVKVIPLTAPANGLEEVTEVGPQAVRHFFSARYLAVASVILAMALAIWIWKWGLQTEWLGQAPASLAVRFRYWIASFKMVAQSPWFGVGPGQFKQRYEAYRADASIEQIADPHNGFWQITTTGGLPAAAFAIVLAAAILWRFVARTHSDDSSSTTHYRSDATLAFAARWIYAGAAASGLAVWIAGAAIGYLPSPDAAILATLCGVSTVWLLARSDRQPSASDTSVAPAWPRQIAGLAAFAIAIDLLAAGGLMVPGVAVTFWLLIALATPPLLRTPLASDGVTDSTSDATRLTRFRWGTGLITMLLLVAWYITAVLPIEKARGAVGRFEIAWGQGRLAEAQSALHQATDSDRWDPDPPLHLVSVLLQIAVADPERRAHWEAAMRASATESIRRSGLDPVTMRQVADGYVWLYQRYGDTTTLETAAEIFEQVVTLAPAHQTYAAQLAEIFRELDDPRASDWATRATTLSTAGGYHERSLPLISILPARHLGDSVTQAAIRRPASELFSEIVQPESVN